MTTGHLAYRPLVLATELRAELAARAHAAYPLEACGLLIGRREAHATVVRSVAQARNRTAARDRYELAPEDWCAAWRDAAARRAEIVGVWHSHPDRGAVPSDADRETAWADYSYLIAAVSKSGVSQLRCWRLDDRSFLEQSVVTTLVS